MASVFGVHAVEAQLSRAPERVRRLFAVRGRSNDRVQSLVTNARQAGIHVEFVTPQTLDRLADGGRHQGVYIESQERVLPSERDLEENWGRWQKPFLLVVEDVQDPRNLGAILRCADAAGVDAVLLPRNRCAPLSGVVHKTASGALESLYLVVVANLARRLKWLQQQGVWIVGAVEEAEQSFTAVDLAQPTAIVVGGEAKGLRRLTRSYCDRLVSIPMLGSVSSLNVSVATGVLLYEVVRQRTGAHRT